VREFSDLNRLTKSPTWLFVAIAAIVLIGMCAGVADFASRWHARGDSFAQAEGMLLAFIAACASVLVTLGFIYLTRRSVEAAQDAIRLEREKWELQLKVEPRMWLSHSGNFTKAVRIDVIRRGNAANMPQPQTAQQIVCYVWNPSQQSFRVAGCLIWTKGDHSCNVDQPVPNIVVAPHAVGEIDVTSSFLRLLFGVPPPNVAYDWSTVQQPHLDVEIKLKFDFWSSAHGEFYEISDSYRLVTSEGIPGITISRLSG